jgi:Fic family protein
MMLDATRNYDQPLTPDRLFGWQASLFPAGRSGLRRLRVGAWRDDTTGPMQVVSGPVGRERVHFEGPPARRLDRMMTAFLRWFNDETGPAVADDVLKAALAHLWFVTIHPFDDGNGRIGRAIADLALARSEHTAQRFYSMSSHIRRERNDYDTILERAQKGTMDVTPWMEWFLGCLGHAIHGAQATLAAVLRKADAWQAWRDLPINERQRVMLNRLLDGFEGKVTTSKWAAITKCSSDTALRDILDLVTRGVLARNPGAGRSTSYALAEGFSLR